MKYQHYLCLILCLTSPCLRAVPAAADQPILIALAIDTSGSLKEPDLEQVRSLTTRLLDELPEGSTITLFSFNDTVEQLNEPTVAHEEISAAIEKLQTGGQYTVLYNAFYEAVHFLESEDTETKVLIIMSDGKDEGSTRNIDDGLRIAVEDTIPVFTIGVGNPTYHDSLRNISRDTHGDFVRVINTGGYSLVNRIKNVLAELHPPPPPPAKDEAELPPQPVDGTPYDLVILGTVLGGLLLIAFGVIFIFYAMNRRRQPECEQCGAILRHAGAVCLNCYPPEPMPAAEEPIPLNFGGAPPPSPGWTVEPLDSGPAEPRHSLAPTRLLHITGATLTIVEGPGAGHSYPIDLKKPNTIGRAPDVEIKLPDPSVSKNHCQIMFVRAGFVLQDLGSTNGTRKNGVNIEADGLEHGDKIQIGETTMELLVEGSDKMLKTMPAINAAKPPATV